MNLEELVKRASQNNKEYRRAMTHPASKKHKGVRLQNNRWEAYTNSSRGWIYIGSFSTEEEAYIARRNYLEEHMPLKAIET